MATRSSSHQRRNLWLRVPLIRGCPVSRALHLVRSFERSVFRPHGQKFAIPITYSGSQRCGIEAQLARDLRFITRKGRGGRNDGSPPSSSKSSTFKKLSTVKMQKLRIAQISNLVAPITDSSTNGLAQIVYNLTQELVDLGHDVTLYAPLHSSTNARLVPLSSLPNASETILGKVLPVAAAFSDWRHFDIIHDHTRFYSTLSAHLVPIPVVSTVHHPVEFDELHWHHSGEEYSTFFRSIWERLVKSVHTVFSSQFQRS